MPLTRRYGIVKGSCGPQPLPQKYAFTVLGYPELALKYMGLTKDPAGAAVAKELEKSQDTAIRGSARMTLAAVKADFKAEANIIEGPESKARKLAKDLGIKSALGILVLQDAFAQHPSDIVGQFSETATKALSGTPKDGVPEKDWLLNFLQARKDFLLAQQNQYDKFLLNSINSLINLVKQEDWDLKSANRLLP